MTFLYLNSNKMGNGDDKLGEILIESFLEKLSNSDIKIDFIGCVNSGVKLTRQGSSDLSEQGRVVEWCLD